MLSPPRQILVQKTAGLDIGRQMYTRMLMNHVWNQYSHGYNPQSASLTEYFRSNIVQITEVYSEITTHLCVQSIVCLASIIRMSILCRLLRKGDNCPIIHEIPIVPQPSEPKMSVNPLLLVLLLIQCQHSNEQWMETLNCCETSPCKINHCSFPNSGKLSDIFK